MTEPAILNRGRARRRVRQALMGAAIGAIALALAGCDKCGDYFWIDGAAPHSCKEAPAAR